MSVQKSRQYVEGMPFTIITDHASLKWLMEQGDLSGRLARWSLKRQLYNFSIEHRRGTQNLVPDALSRMFCDGVKLVSEIDDSELLGVSYESNAFSDDEYQNSVHVLQHQNGFVTNTKIINGRIYVNLKSGDKYTDSDVTSWKLVIPTVLIPEIICRAHNSPTGAHAGIRKTLEVIKRYFYWPRMNSQVYEHITNCTTCKMTKAINITLRPPIGQYHEIIRPWQKIFVDFLVPYPRSRSGNSMLIIVLDQFSKFIVLKPLKHATSETLVECLKKDVFSLFGVPDFLHSDNGRQFESHMLADFLKKFGVTHVFTPKYSPQSNASERVNRTILAAIREYVRI